MKICQVKFKYFPEGEIRNTLYFIYQTPILVLKTVFNRANKKQNVMEVSIQGRLIAQIFLQLQSFTFFFGQCSSRHTSTRFIQLVLQLRVYRFFTTIRLQSKSHLLNCTSLSAQSTYGMYVCMHLFLYVCVYVCELKRKV